MSVAIEITVDGLDEALQALRPIFDFEPLALMTAIGAIGESQTRRRISEEKTAPDGSAWKENLKGTSILNETGQHLLYSIAWTASADEAVWGAAWEYAHVHQDGAVIKPKDAERLAVPKAAFGGGPGFVRPKQVEVPARPFVGLSEANRQEIIDLVSDHFGIAQ